MRFSVLGPLLAEADDGTPLALLRPSQRATLAVLLLFAGQPMAKGLLIDALWGDSPPAAADSALRVRVSDVRRALAQADRIQTRPAGYQVVVKPGELDVDSFCALRDRGRKALDDGNSEHAARLLDQACRLWRDPPLADVPDTPRTRTTVTALLAQRRDAREWLIDARLAIGQHHELLSEIRTVIGDEPLAEHPHVQLMLALYRSGQKIAALDAYSRLRELTTREFGQDPGPEARETLRRILSDNPALDVRPRLSATARTSSWPAWTPLRQLPAPPPDFTGRVTVMAALARRMPGSSMAVTVLTGPPGVGTTALAIQAAHLAAAEFPDGQLFIDLGGRLARREPAAVLGELLRSFGVADASIPDALAERAALHRSMLAGRRVLLLADNAAAAAQIRPLLPGTRGSAVLVTSHSRLADLEGAHCIEVSPLSQAEAMVMLGKIAGRDLDSERAAVAAIVSACAGLPLALRVAGARLAADPALGPADLAAALAVPGNLLAELVVGDLSVAKRLAAAWQLLEPDAQHALWLLAHAHQPCNPSWLVQAVTGGSPGAVRTFADSSLVLRDPSTGGYGLAPLVEIFALSQPSPWPSTAGYAPSGWLGAVENEYEQTAAGA